MSTTDTAAATAGRADDTAAGRAAGATPMERQEAEGLERTAAHHITLTTPISREDIEDIRVGDVVFLDGRITTAGSSSTAASCPWTSATAPSSTPGPSSA